MPCGDLAGRSYGRKDALINERDWLAERFDEHRSRLRSVAYRMLGSVSEADDAVQETWLRFTIRHGRMIAVDSIDDPERVAERELALLDA